jgi:hypothetical protein
LTAHVTTKHAGKLAMLALERLAERKRSNVAVVREDINDIALILGAIFMRVFDTEMDDAEDLE